MAAAACSSSPACSLASQREAPCSSSAPRAKLSSVCAPRRRCSRPPACLKLVVAKAVKQSREAEQHAASSLDTDDGGSSSRGSSYDAEVAAAGLEAPHASGGPQSTPPAASAPAAAAEVAEAGGGGFSGGLKAAASLGVVGGLVLLVGGGLVMKDHINAFLDTFIALVDDWGALGVAAYVAVYAALEILAVPAIPLTMTAGAIFGVPAGTAVVSLAATLACTGAFLISRYVARDRVQQYAASHPRFAAIDAAIGRDGFRVVALLRLSPLLPLAASNYLYGLTSVDLGSYVLGSWLGMLPGTAAYVAAGTYGKQLLEGGGGGVEGVAWWQVALAVGASGAAVLYIGSLAKAALADVDLEGVGQAGGDGAAAAAGEAAAAETEQQQQQRQQREQEQQDDAQ